MMRHPSSRRAGGFTIVELLISSSIMVLALIGVYLAFDTTSATYSRGQGRTEVQENTRVAMDQMGRQIRMAGYFPENYSYSSDANGNPVAPFGPWPPTLANPVQLATNNAFAFYADADGTWQSALQAATAAPPFVAPAPPFSNVFLFCLSQDLSIPAQPIYRLWRLRNSAPLTAAAYTCPAGPLPAPANATVLAEFPDLKGTSLSFTYYDGNGNPIPNPPTPPYTLDGQGLGAVPSFAVTTQRAAVRRVLIALTTQRDDPGHQPERYTLTSDVRLRNFCLSC